MSQNNQTTIDPLIPRSLMEALKDAFQVQASTPIEILSATALAPSARTGIEIASAIGLKSTNYTGTLALCFPEKTFLGVINRMLGESYSEINKDNSDAAGEMLNIIFGSARVKMNAGSHDFLPAIPTVARGVEISISHGNSPMIIKIECKCEFGTFHLEISLRKI